MPPEQKSRLPASGDAGRQGRQASPPDPTGNSDDEGPKLTEKLDLRCTIEEKIVLRKKAAVAGVSASQLLREALGLTDAKRRKPVPAAPPEIVSLVAQTTRDIQGFAYDARKKMGSTIPGQLEALNLIGGLLTLDRRVSDLMIRLDGDGQ
jgi:hypothetical protein